MSHSGRIESCFLIIKKKILAGSKIPKRVKVLVESNLNAQPKASTLCTKFVSAVRKKGAKRFLKVLHSRMTCFLLGMWESQSGSFHNHVYEFARIIVLVLVGNDSRF